MFSQLNMVEGGGGSFGGLRLIFPDTANTAGLLFVMGFVLRRALTLDKRLRIL